MNDKVKWVRLEDYIEVYDRKNTNGKTYPFYGINKDKTFMPTVADTNELDNTKYKIVSKGVFVFSGMQTGRDVCIRITVYDGRYAYSCFSRIHNFQGQRFKRDFAYLSVSSV